MSSDPDSQSLVEDVSNNEAYKVGGRKGKEQHECVQLVFISHSLGYPIAQSSPILLSSPIL